jgi:hypothetical protein
MRNLTLSEAERQLKIEKTEDLKTRDGLADSMYYRTLSAKDSARRDRVIERLLEEHGGRSVP